MAHGKDEMEEMCRKAGMRPASREEYRGETIFVQEGFSLIPHVQYERFMIKEGEFPHGAFMTMWWTAKGEDKFDVGRPLFFDVNHDQEQPQEFRSKMRINSAVADAKAFINRRSEAKARNYA